MRRIIFAFSLVASLIGLNSQPASAATIVWTNLNGGLWSAATNWSPNQVPAGADTAVITNAGSYTITNNATTTITGLTLGDTNSPGTPKLIITAGTFTTTNTTVASNGVFVLSAGTVVTAGPTDIAGTFNQASGTWQLNVPANINNYGLTNGELRGANCVITNLNWVGGSLNSDALGNTTTIPVGGTLTISSATAKNLSAYVGSGRTLLNQGTGTWSGAGITGYYGAPFRNAGVLTIASDVSFVWVGNPYGPAAFFENSGTITKSGGSGNFALSTVFFNNTGTIDIQSGTLQFNGTTSATNSGAINIGTNSTLDVSCSYFRLGGSLTSVAVDRVRFNSTTVDINTTNISTPSLWIQAGLVNQNTNVVVPVINQSGSSEWRPTLPVSVATYNLTNGAIRGANSTITNLNWFAGNLTSDGVGSNVVTIPSGGTLNISTAGAKALFSNLGQGRTLLNQGTANWTGGTISGYYGAIFRNEGTLNVAGDLTFSWPGNPYGPAAVFQNTGSVTRTSGTGFFSFSSTYVDSTGPMDIQSGSLQIAGCLFNNSSSLNVQAGNLVFNAASSATNAGSITLSASGILDASCSYLKLGGSLIAPTANSVRLNSTTVDINTTNLNTPTLWFQGGLINQNTNVVVPTYNQSGSSEWRPTLPVSVATYNLTNGAIRGANSTITNLNWLAGNLTSDGVGSNVVTIPSGGTLNLSTTGAKALFSNLGQGRTLLNQGTATWTGGTISGHYGAIFRNEGTLNVAGDLTFSWPGNPYGPASSFDNAGTVNRISGTGNFTFSSVFWNNSGLVDVQTGTLFLNGSTSATNSGFFNFTAATTFDASCSYLKLVGSLIAPTANSVRLNSTTVDINTTNLNTPTLWFQGGLINQNTNVVVPTYNQSGSSEWRPTLPVSVATYNLTNGTIRGANSTITNLNWLAGNLTSDGVGSNVVTIPSGGTLNISTAGAKALFSNLGQGRTLLNQGTATWTGGTINAYYGSLFRNEGTLTVSSDLAYAWVGNPYGPQAIFQNTGSITRSSGTGLFSFNSVVLNNSGLMDIQTGTLSVSGSTFTNLAGGNLLTQSGAVFANDGGSASVFEPGSSIGCVSTNAFRVNSGTVTLRTTSVTAPSLWINGGTLNQNTNNVVATINQGSGVWWLNLPTTATTYNFTNGELRGANLTLNTFNWQGGALNSDGPGSNTVTVSSALNISGANPKSMSYYALPGRTLINNGTGTWGGVNISGAGAATFRNNGTLAVTNDVALVYGSGAATVFHNTGTYLKTNSTGTATFSGTTITNSGTMTVSSGSFSVGGAFTQTSGTTHLGTNFTASSTVRVEAGTFTGRGTIAGAFFNNGIVNPGASPGLISGTIFTNTSSATVNFELGGTNAVTNFDAVRLIGAASLDGSLKVLLVNGFTPQLSNSFEVMRFASRSGTYASVVPPPGVGLTAVYSTTNLVLNVTALSNAPLEIVNAPTNVTVWEPDSATFSVVASGVTPVTYQWQFNNVDIIGATNTTFTVTNTVVTNSGTYKVVVTDGLAATTNASATLTVLPFTGTIYWVNTNGGDWHTASNWEPPRVPGPTNTAVIITNGTYTVNINAAAAVSNLVVGISNAVGTPTLHLVSPNNLALSGNSVFETNAVLALNGTLQMTGGTNDIRGRIDWQLGTLSGPGRTIITNGASITFIGSLNQKNISGHVLENHGSFNYGNDSFGNAQMLRFAGGAQLTNHPTGVINIGTAALEYAGSQTPRSYLVNYGTINANSSVVFSPSYISIDFINYGTLQDNGYAYISRGTNYGTFSWGNTLCEISVFGDETAGEYFSFEDGTTFVGTLPQLAVGGYAQWNTTAPHPGNVRVISGSGGASFANPEFRVLKNYTQTGTTTVNKGRWTMANSNLIANLNVMNDGLVNGFHTFTISNAGTIVANSLSHNVRNLANTGTILVKSNLSLTGSSYTYGGGSLVITNTATANFAGGTVESQFVNNLGVNSVSGGMTFTGGTFYWNRSAASTVFGGGSFGSGPASVLNDGSINGYGGMTIAVTNRNTILADDSLNRFLALGSYVQESGLTVVGPGQASGDLRILGGQLTGVNAINGSVYNAAQFNPGNPTGLLSISGSHTNTASGIHRIAIGGTNLYSRVNVGSSAQLNGTLDVSFVNGFTPMPGNIFTVMTFSARSGVFSSDNVAARGMTIQYSSTNILLLADNLLPTVAITSPGDNFNSNCICEPFILQANAADADGSITNVTFLWNSNLLSVVTNAPYRLVLVSDQPGVQTFSAIARDNRGGETTTNINVRFYGRGGTNVLTPYLIAVDILTNNPVIPKKSIKLCMEGEPGRNYDIEAATDLIASNWNVIGQITLTNNQWIYYDTNATNFTPDRFYRAVRLPRSP